MGKREWIEHYQIIFYIIALALGLAIGLAMPENAGSLSAMISPLLAVLLTVMFSQIPFLELRIAMYNKRFIGALVMANFVVVPLVVWGLTFIFPQSPPIFLGVYLVLLTPCIDYVIVFSQLGHGDAKLMLAATPFLFILQVVLLPIYLWIFLGKEYIGLMKIEPFVEAFMLLIVGPLLLAIAIQLWSKKMVIGGKTINIMAWLPVPFMAIVLFVVVTSQIWKLRNDYEQIVGVIPIYLLFLLVMPIFSRIIGGLFRLNAKEGRTLIFSSGTRNSLVVLPLALSLPKEQASLVAAVVVMQTVIELFGEMIYIRLIPMLVWRGGE